MNINKLEAAWAKFVDVQRQRSVHGKRAYIDKQTDEARVIFLESVYFKGNSFEQHLIDFFSKGINATGKTL